MKSYLKITKNAFEAELYSIKLTNIQIDAIIQPNM